MALLFVVPYCYPLTYLHALPESASNRACPSFFHMLCALRAWYPQPGYTCDSRNRRRVISVIGVRCSMSRSRGKSRYIRKVILLRSRGDSFHNHRVIVVWYCGWFQLSPLNNIPMNRRVVCIQPKSPPLYTSWCYAQYLGNHSLYIGIHEMGSFC